VTDASPRTDERASRRFLVLLVVVALAALAVRVAFTVVVDPDVPEVGDAMAYHMLGENLADGLGYIRPFDRTILGEIRPTAEYPPMLPAILAGAQLVGIGSVGSQQLVLGLIGTGTVVVIGLLGRRLAGETVGLVAAGIATVYPMLFQADAILMPETPFTFLVATSVLFAHRARAHPTVARFALLGAATGLAGLTRGEGALLAVLLVTPFVWFLRSLPWRRRLVLVGVGLAAAAMVIAPWTIRNAVRFDGAFIPVSNNIGTALDGANCDQAWYGRQAGLWLYECFGGFDLSDQTEAEATAFHRDRGVQYIRDHTSRLPAVLAIRQGRTWAFYDVEHSVVVESFEGRDITWQRWGTRFYWALLPFAVGGTVVLARRRAFLWPVFSTVVLVVVTTAVTYGNQRFRVAAEPAIVVLAATGMVTLARRLRPGDTAAAGEDAVADRAGSPADADADAVSAAARPD
jgi:4-amino-4-deoxy-L-arabinose transferase-like glycosyltransferase